MGLIGVLVAVSVFGVAIYAHSTLQRRRAVDGVDEEAVVTSSTLELESPITHQLSGAQNAAVPTGTLPYVQASGDITDEFVHRSAIFAPATESLSAVTACLSGSVALRREAWWANPSARTRSLDLTQVSRPVSPFDEGIDMSLDRPTSPVSPLSPTPRMSFHPPSFARQDATLGH